MPGWFLMLEGSPTGAGNLDWFAREFLGDTQTLLARRARALFSRGRTVPWS
jgi:sugar (pentulose or hexulose) kinase